MVCVCCSSELTRARDLPETRGWLRPGDLVCPQCEWIYPRELLGEEGLIVMRCRIHSEPAAGVLPQSE